MRAMSFSKPVPNQAMIRAGLTRAMADYDRVVTAPLHGFADERDPERLERLVHSIDLPLETVDL